MNYAKSYTLVEGKIQKEEEKLIFIKFSKEKESEVLNFIKKLHLYEIPQLIILNAQFVDENYLKDC